MELNIEELQYLLNAIDTHVRANGLVAAIPGAIIAQKIQTAANALPTDPIPDGDNGEQ